jgi:1-acyl-sn-glycerol-3-phosphate acyltransferase
MSFPVPNTPASPRGRHAVRRGVRLLCRVALRVMGVRVSLKGAVPREPVLYLANHLSWLDIVAILARCDCTFVAKREVRQWPIVGWLASLMGVVWIDRTRRRDVLRAIPQLEATLRGGASVLLFPEGTTSAGRQLLPFKSALVEGAVRAGVAVVPLAVTAAALPPSDALYWTGEETLLHSIPRVVQLIEAHVTLHAAPPVAWHPSRKQLTYLAREAIARRTVGGAITERARLARVGRPAVTAVAS